MGYWHRPPRPRKPAPRAAPVPPGLEMIAQGEGFYDMPLGGYAGGVLPATPAPPQPEPQPDPFMIPPPPWLNPDGSLGLAAVAPTEPTSELSGPDKMRLANETYDPEPFEYHPQASVPLTPFVPPKPDWQEEARELERRRTAETQAAVEPDPQTYPAKRQQR